MGWNGIRWEEKGLSFYLIAILPGDLLKTQNVILDSVEYFLSFLGHEKEAKVFMFCGTGQ